MAWSFDLGICRLNAEDAAILFSEQHPGRLIAVGDAVHWYPVHCATTCLHSGDPDDDDAHGQNWLPGAARTVRCKISLSNAPAEVARYRAPSWWYSLCGEPWPYGYLPVAGDINHVGISYANIICQEMTRGRFDGGTADSGNFGLAGTGLLHAYYQTGKSAYLHDGLDYCYFWTDLMVDHRDFSIRQWAGGAGWKTCAYSFFRDALFGYLGNR